MEEGEPTQWASTAHAFHALNMIIVSFIGSRPPRDSKVFDYIVSNASLCQNLLLHFIHSVYKFICFNIFIHTYKFIVLVYKIIKAN